MPAAAGGGTFRDHLQAARRAGEQVPELDLPPMPPALEGPLTAFIECSAGRRYHPTGGHPLALGPADILAWLQLNGRRRSGRLIWFIRELDRRWLEVQRAGHAGEIHPSFGDQQDDEDD